MNKKMIGIVGGLVLLVGGFLMIKPTELKTDLPFPPEAKSVIQTGEDAINYQTDLSVMEVEDFYRSVLTGQGLTERKLLTAKTDTTLSFVFDGHTSGKSVVVQAVALEKDTNVNVRLETL